MVIRKLQVYFEHFTSPQQQLAKIISKSSFIEQPIKLNVCIPSCTYNQSFLFCLVRWLSREQDKNQTLPIKKKKTHPTPQETQNIHQAVRFEKNIYRWCLKVTLPSLPFVAYLKAQKQATVRKTEFLFIVNIIY